MRERDPAPERAEAGNPEPAPRAKTDKVQCPNCCRLARVTSRRMGLLFFKCDLCGTMGAAPDATVP